MAWARVALLASCLPLSGGDIKLAREFKSGNLGLMDLSSDGTLLAFHRHGSKGVERIIVKRSSDAKTVGELAIDFGSGHWLIAFVPGTHELLLNGPSYQRWNPETGGRKALKGPDNDFRFDGFIDDHRALALLYTSPPSSVIWNVATGELSPADLQRNDPALLPTPEARNNLKKKFTDLSDRKVYIAARSSPGNLVIASGPANSSDVDPRKSEYFLGVYDLNTGARIGETRLFDDEHPEDKSGWLGQGRYVDGLLQDIAYQMAISPDGRAVALSYERDTVPFPAVIGLTQTEVKYAVYSLPSLEHIGTVSHPKVKTPEPGWRVVSPVTSGHLLFSKDSKSLYTTVEWTREWRIEN